MIEVTGNPEAPLLRLLACASFPVTFPHGRVRHLRISRGLMALFLCLAAVLSAGCVSPRHSGSPESASDFQNPLIHESGVSDAELPASGMPSCYQSPWLDKFACEKPVISKVPYSALRQQLKSYIDEKKNEGMLVDAGIYFRDLEDGPHFGINEYANFAAASLLKLPIVIQYMSFAERNADLLKRKLIVPPGFDLLYGVKYLPPEKLVPGDKHTIEDLMFRTVAYSDNLAFIMLRQYLINSFGDEDFIWESYRQIGLVPDVTDKNYVISVVRYASIFKLIYSASVLNTLMSERFIDMLRATTYRSGLVAGVPEGVEVAHKFGELEREGVFQLHDCGIIYYPGNPYVLCVMTRGDSYDELEMVIGEISRMVYSEVDSRRLE